MNITWHRMIAGVIAAACLMAMGCSTTHNQVKLNQDGAVETVMSNANTMRISETGEQQATFAGPASQVWEDAEGVKAHIGMPVAVLYFNTGGGVPAEADGSMGGGTIHLISPNDAEMQSFTYTPVPPDGEPMLSITGLKWNVSEPIKAAQETLVAYVEQLAAMSADERAAWVEEVKARGEVASEVIDAAMAIVTAMGI